MGNMFASTGKDRGAAFLQLRAKPSQMPRSIVQTFLFASFSRSSRENSFSDGCAVSASMAVRMKSFGRGVRSTRCESAEATAEEVK